MRIKPKFQLKNPLSKGLTSIQLVVYYKGRRLLYGTGRSIYPDLWNPKTQRPSFDPERIRKYKDQDRGILAILDSINSNLSKLEADVKKYIERQIDDGVIPEPKEVRLFILSRPYTPKAKRIETFTKTTLNEFIGEFIVGMETGKIKTQKKTVYTPGSIKNYKGFQAQLLNYQDNRSKVIDFEDVTLDFYDDFVNYFQEKNYKTNTIGRHIKNLKTIMLKAKDKKLHNNTEYERGAFKILQVEAENIYLTDTEILRMESLHLPPHLEKARDLFLIGCFTGLRFSDISSISSKHVKGIKTNKPTLNIITQKTGKRVIIPMNRRLFQLLEKWNWVAPHVAEQKVNKYIKEIGEMAGINEPTTIEEEKGGILIKRTVPKYMLIMTHTARRSALTNMYKAGIPIYDIMQISGHTTEKNFRKYIKMDSEETATRLSDHPYFNKGNLKVV